MRKNSAGLRGESLRRRARLFFHSPAVRFSVGKSMRYIRYKGKFERNKRERAR